jgi:hypothetical protein
MCGTVNLLIATWSIQNNVPLMYVDMGFGEFRAVVDVGGMLWM